MTCSKRVRYHPKQCAWEGNTYEYAEGVWNKGEGEGSGGCVKQW